MAPREPSSLCEQIRLFICIILYMLVFLLPPTNDDHMERAFMTLVGTYSLTHPSLKVNLSLYHVLSRRRNSIRNFSREGEKRRKSSEENYSTQDKLNCKSLAQTQRRGHAKIHDICLHPENNELKMILFPRFVFF